MIIEFEEYSSLKMSNAQLNDKVEDLKEMLYRKTKVIDELTDKLSIAGTKIINLTNDKNYFEAKANNYQQFFQKLSEENKRLEESYKLLLEQNKELAQKHKVLEEYLNDHTETIG